ncbi:MAG: BA14K family protein [Rhizobiaceae bacterium]
MKKFLTLLSAGVLAFAMAGPAAAGGDTDMTPHPFAPRSSFGAGNLGNPGGGGFYRVRDHHRRGHGRDHWRGHNRRGFYNHGGYGWYNGPRGYRHYRHGYREYNGWWFPAAILGGAIIGNAIVNAPSNGGSAHVQWCYNRYRSYRASDNTYQPYGGPRRQCVSPY